MVQISHKINEDGTVLFTASVDGDAKKHSLLMRIDQDENAFADEIHADDDDIYDGLVKTAAAFAARRGISFNKEGISWKPTQCQNPPNRKPES